MPGKKGQRSKKLAVIDRKRSKALAGGRSLDGRTRDARYLRVTYASLCVDLGGEESLSTQQRLLAQQAAWQSARLLNLQADLQAGRSYDDQRYSAILNSLLGLLRNLGMERKAKTVSLRGELAALDKGGTDAN